MQVLQEEAMEEEEEGQEAEAGQAGAEARAGAGGGGGGGRCHPLLRELRGLWEQWAELEQLEGPAGGCNRHTSGHLHAGRVASALMIHPARVCQRPSSLARCCVNICAALCHPTGQPGTRTPTSLLTPVVPGSCLSCTMTSYRQLPSAAPNPCPQVCPPAACRTPPFTTPSCRATLHATAATQRRRWVGGVDGSR